MEPNKHILVVLTDAATRAGVKVLLEAAGHRVRCAASSREALECLTRPSLPFLILLDASLPAMDGWQFHREHRQTPHLAVIPILVYSGQPDAPRATTSLGVSCFPSPVEVDGLLEAVRAIDEARSHA